MHGNELHQGIPPSFINGIPVFSIFNVFSITQCTLPFVLITRVYISLPVPKSLNIENNKDGFSHNCQNINSIITPIFIFMGGVVRGRGLDNPFKTKMIKLDHVEIEKLNCRNFFLT